jgi:hypothetical protein
MIQPGEIDLADFEEMEPHPIVVVSREELNSNTVKSVLSRRYQSTWITIPCSARSHS